MTPYVPDSELITCTSFRANSCTTEILTNVSALLASPKRESALGGFVDHVVFREHPTVDHIVFRDHLTEKDHLMRTRRTETVSPAILKDAIAGIFGMIEKTMSSSVTTKRKNGVKRIENILQTMLQCLVNKALDIKFNFVEFGGLLFHTLEQRTTLRWEIETMTEDMLGNQDCFPPMATMFRKKSEWVVGVESEKEDRRQNFVEAA